MADHGIVPARRAALHQRRAGCQRHEAVPVRPGQRRMSGVVIRCSGSATLCASRFQPNKKGIIRLRHSSDCLCRILHDGRMVRKPALKAAEFPSTIASIYGSPDRGSPGCGRGSTPHKSRVVDSSNGLETIPTTPTQGSFLAGLRSGSGLNPGFESLRQRPAKKALTP